MDEKKCMKLYNSILRIVKKDIGSNTTYTDTLHRYGKKKLGSEFVGVTASDRIPRLSLTKRYAIVNLDNHNEKGSHWVALCYTDDKEHLVYDSFGRRANKILKNKLEMFDVINSDLDREQSYRESDCGARSLAYCIFHNIYGTEAALKI